ncbi:MAG: cytochrome c oxidase subunit II [SAR324 cluster bacterium]|nr:cytochrome c oxidase subunit II [SAR324 cluster bacterium]
MNIFPVSASTFSGDIDGLFWLVTTLVGFWFILSELLLFYLIFRFRRKKGVKAQYIAGESRKEMAWIFVPLFFVILCDISIDLRTHSVWQKIKETLPQATEKVRVIGQQWTWVFVHPGPDGVLDTSDDIETVNELHVKVNTTTHYELQSRDVLHNFSVPVFRLKQDAIPGRAITGWFEATQTGEYDIQCAEMCGIGHGLMGARIFIDTQEQYETWMAQEIQKQQNYVASK